MPSAQCKRATTPDPSEVRQATIGPGLGAARYPGPHMGSGDEPTMTAAGPASAGAAPTPGDTVGRYVLDRVLGAGGMGVVYAAHDPDLERAVALKLLRAGRDDAQARARLLREARAMAKLSHPNVIVVHEVGTAAGRDFVAMELIDGVNVHEWLAQRRRPVAEVLPVLLAAGRGLAAAHRAGLVHRDFKPHNVLRGRDGRVVVTDFGLARAIDDTTHEPTSSPSALPDATGLDETVEASATPRPATGSASLSSTLTATGAMLGTPAYMAPEQFLGGATGPATDQFAFSVAAWEALAGVRPFRGGNVEELRRSVTRGVTEPAPTLPRRLRVVLERGLRQDPAARWPSMDALLAALDAAARRPRRIALAAGGVGLAGLATAAIVLTRGGTTTAAACTPADQLLVGAWSPHERAAIDDQFASEPVGLQRMRGAIDGWVTRWRELYDATCSKPKAPEFHGRVACLTNARDELEALVSMAEGAPPEMIRGVHLADILTPADGCDTPMGRNVPPPPSDPVVAEQMRALRQRTAVARVRAGTGRAADAVGEIDAIVAESRALGWAPQTADAVYSRAVILHIAGDLEAAEAAYDDAAMEAEAAGDDPKRAAALVGYLEVVMNRTLDGPRIRAIAKRALAAIERAGDDPVLRASVDVNLSRLDVADGALDLAIARVESARAVFARVGDQRRTANTAGVAAQLHQLRAGDGDDAAAEALLREELALQDDLVGPTHPRTLAAIEALALVRWTAGDLDEAHALFDRLRGLPTAEPVGPLRAITGRVVDAAGVGVAGAVVHLGSPLIGDPRSLVLPTTSRWQVEVTTGADGGFTAEVPAGVVAIAEHGATRSAPATPGTGEVTLVLGATVEMTGRLRVVGESPGGAAPALVAARRVIDLAAGLDAVGGTVLLRAPLDGDGAWRLPGVPLGAYTSAAALTTGLGDIRFVQRAVTASVGRNAAVEHVLSRAGAVVDVVVRVDRAASLASAQVFVVPGEHAIASVAELEQAGDRAGTFATAFAAPIDEHGRTDPGEALYQAGDLHGLVSMVVAGPTTFCVVPFDGDVADPDVRARVIALREHVDVSCVVVTVADQPAIQAFVDEVAPPKRMPPR